MTTDEAKEVLDWMLAKLVPSEKGVMFLPFPGQKNTWLLATPILQEDSRHIVEFFAVVSMEQEFYKQFLAPGAEMVPEEESRQLRMLSDIKGPVQ